MRLFNYAPIECAKRMDDNEPDTAIRWLAGGTTLVDLMKLDVETPAQVVDIRGLSGPKLRSIEVSPAGLWLGALCTMAEVARHEVVRGHYPVVAQSLLLAASGQIRNMATVGGNVLQRTRCEFFRDVTYGCNKRQPGSGCPAIDLPGRNHAVLGTSDSCIASYPGDFAQALIVLDARMATTGALDGSPFSTLHRMPDASPDQEHRLEDKELITGFYLPPPSSFTRRSCYVKVRDRQSYAFALASAAVAMELDGDVVADCAIALGGVATVPWRVHEAKRILVGQPLNEEAATRCADAALAAAQLGKADATRVTLARAVVVRALLQAASMLVVA